MHKKFIYSYLFILFLLLASLSISKKTSEKWRGETFSFFSPLWEQLLSIKFTFTEDAQIEKSRSEDQIQHLQLENQLLQIEIADLHHLLHYQKKIQNKLDQLAETNLEGIEEVENIYQKAIERITQNLKWQVKAMPARVIFRSFDQWNSTVWINVGLDNNQNELVPIIAKNSPVLIDQAIVGVIDYVGKHQARVRLITDSSITPSVRAARGGEYDLLMIDYIDNISHAMTPKIASSLNFDEYNQIKYLLGKLKQSLQPCKKSWYLAKGELQGSILPLGYGPPILKGTGFNYDFSDEEGECRDLRTGKINSSANKEALPILKVDDVLVTTGMDGIFPPGLKVAQVSKIYPLKEGDYFYELEAKPIASNLEKLSLVFVIPPLREWEDFSTSKL